MQPNPAKFSARAIKAFLWMGTASLAFALFIKITSELLEHEVSSVDRTILVDVAKARTPWLTMVAVDLTALGSVTLVVLISTIALCVLLLLKDRMGALQLVAASVGAGILTTTIKDYIDRARPEVVTQLVEASGLSYPSGHSVAATSLYLTVAIVVSRHLQRTGHQIAILAMTVGIVLLVGMTRIYLGVHYPSDVASGISLGAAWALLLAGCFSFFPGPRKTPVDKVIPTMRRIQSVLWTFWLSALVLLSATPLASQITSSTSEIKPPDLDLILQRIEDAQRQSPAQSQPYEVTREYKVFRGDDSRPTSEVIAQIDFVPPNTKTYKIVESRGNSWGAKIVRELLSSETSPTRKEHSTEISKANYDFVFLRQQNFGSVPEYVFAIFPKRKDKYLLRGQIWVDAHSFRIRQIEGAPAKSLSFWLKNLHITLQYGELGGMWVPVTFDAIATVRILGEFTLEGISIRRSDSKLDDSN